MSRSSNDGDLLDRPGQVVVDVAEVAADLLGHVADAGRPRVGERPLQRQHRPLELHQLPLELVDLLRSRPAGRAAKTPSSSCVDVVLDLAGDVEVRVDDPVGRPRTPPPTGPARAASGPLSRSARTRTELAGVAVPHGDHEVASPMNSITCAGLDDLGGLGQLAVLDVPGGAQHGERHRRRYCSIFGRWSPVQGVLDRKFVQPERLGDGGQLSAARFDAGRATRTRPDHDEPCPAPRRSSTSRAFAGHARRSRSPRSSCASSRC